jgi:nitroreductase
MIEDIIRNRRTVKPAKMNGQLIPDDIIDTMLEMGDWAPTHGRTEPWRFIVFDHDNAVSFCRQHAELYKSETSEEKFLSATYEKLLRQADMVSHLIIVYGEFGTNPKIPREEEIAAVSACIQNLLLYATAKGVSSFWSTGGMTYTDKLKELLNINVNGYLSGLLYFGYSSEVSTAGSRKLPVSGKVRRVYTQ